MEPEVSLIVISEDNTEEIVDELKSISIPHSIDTDSLGTDKDLVVFDGHEFHYDEVEKQFVENTELADDMLVKKGSQEAPGLYKMGSTRDVDYREIG